MWQSGKSLGRRLIGTQARAMKAKFRQCMTAPQRRRCLLCMSGKQSFKARYSRSCTARSLLLSLATVKECPQHILAKMLIFAASRAGSGEQHDWFATQSSLV
eukprot:1338511-Amphidinium_carterae.3